MKVYIAESHDGHPVAVFAHKDDAVAFGDVSTIVYEVVEYHLFYGQPQHTGFQQRKVVRRY